MITRGTANWSRVRRLLSPTEWFVRWFDLPRTDSQPEDRGLVLVQIDGLSRQQLQRAMDDGRMPFLKSLLTREEYRLHDFYSGLPSSTPSVQGEMFYGVRCAVPAFGFRNHNTGEVVRMFARDTASQVEERLKEHGEGVLANGSAYCNVYGGGASEVHFCASNLGWDELIKGRPWKLTLFLLWHFWSAMRMLGLMVVEFILALGGFIQGALDGRECWQELMMVPARVVVVILLRELATVGASLDVARGLRVVQVNFLGYDEQAHRRGPHSQFAHWTLKGIDCGIYQLWRAAHRSARREYDVWVYSDHGQETTTPYEYVVGKRIGEAADTVVRKVCGECSETNSTCNPETSARAINRRKGDATANRARWLGASWIVGKLFGEDDREAASSQAGVQVAALGPLGLIYTNRDISTAVRLRIASHLVRDHSVPIAFVSKRRYRDCNYKRGAFRLARATRPRLRCGSSFLDRESRVDMTLLCQHR